MTERKHRIKQNFSNDVEDDNEYVYAIGHPHGFVKIGFSTDPENRFDRLQTGSPYELWIIVQLPVKEPREIESELHEHFAEKHVRGEWFDLDVGDYDTLTDLMKMANSNQEFDSLEDYYAWQRVVERNIF